MNKAAAFLMAMRSPVLFELLTKKQHAFHLLFFIAYTLNRDGSPNIYGCRLGESRVSYKGSGLTHSQFRTAKKYLQEAGLAEFYTRGHGKGKKAYAKLTNTNLFDPNIVSKEHSLEQHNQSNSDSIVTSKNLDSNDCFSDCYTSEMINQNPNNNSIMTHKQRKNEHNNDQEQEEKNQEKRRKKSDPEKSSQALEQYLGLAEKLYQSILLAHPNMKKPKSLEKWACEIERIIRIDGKSIERVQEIIEYLPHDAFWCNHVLSADKLRKHFEKLEQEKLNSEIKKASGSRIASRIAWAKEQCRPIHDTDPNAYFEFQDTYLIVGNKRQDDSTYIKIYFNSNGFEEQLDNALRKKGLR